MARNSPNIDYSEDYYKGFAKLYFNGILKKIIEFGSLKEEEGIILDFGAGVGHLKKILNDKKVINYDIIPELSDVKDYKTIKPNKIVCNAVLEHLYREEIDDLMKDFKKMNPKAELLVFLPTENFFSKLGMILTRNKKITHPARAKKGNTTLAKHGLAYYLDVPFKYMMTYPFRQDVRFSHPLNKFIPIYYSTFWGDYWNYYIQQRFNIDYQARDNDRYLVTPQRISSLALQNRINLLPTVLIFLSFIYQFIYIFSRSFQTRVFFFIYSSVVFISY